MSRIDARFELDTPHGRLTGWVGPAGLVALDFADSQAAGRPDVPALDDHPARTQLDEYLRGVREEFELELDLSDVTPFRRRVYEALLAVPHGRTTSYGELARAIGRPTAARAVGGAVGANPVPVVIPCHRVLAGDGSLGGFSGGLHNKRWLLSHERAAPVAT